MKQYLNALPDEVKHSSSKSTHAIKSFLMRYAVGKGAIGFANGIKVNLENFKPAEFFWDAAGKVPNRSYPGEDYDLTFVAESENQIDINKIIEDANKLPIARADVRLMFFRANDAAQCSQFFDRLYRSVQAASQIRARRRLHHGRHGHADVGVCGAQADAAARWVQHESVGRVLTAPVPAAPLTRRERG